MWRTKSSSHMRFYADPKAWDSEDKALKRTDQKVAFFFLVALANLPVFGKCETCVCNMWL